MTALENVSMELHAGKVNALIGENGAGKSTLMKILSGIYPDFEGRILFDGKPVRFSGPREALENGIAIIHQELNLIPWLSIAGNIFLGQEITGRWGLLDRKKMYRITRSLLARLKLNLDPATPVYKLKVGQQQGVEIAKALLSDAKVVIMDEPTSAISESEVEVLFRIVEDLRRENKTVVYISHKLDELFRIADRYVVLRDGRAVASGAMKSLSRAGIIAKMSGADIRALEKPGGGKKHEPLLSAENICLRHPGRPGAYLLNNISFSLGKGEVVGLFGLMGAGRTELLETLFGLHPGRSSGTVRIAQEAQPIRRPADAIRAGMALVPEDRKKDGLVLGMSVRRNISLTSLKQLETWGLLSSGKEGALAGKYIREL
ncbi:MAG TPA: sugar ABC transporter ATP-binding protein, partial [Anseongella sp.]|nr:sugar ABC transporter ATP-binding protein [Anseongella sp.]